MAVKKKSVKGKSEGKNGWPIGIWGGLKGLVIGWLLGFFILSRFYKDFFCKGKYCYGFSYFYDFEIALGVGLVLAFGGFFIGVIFGYVRFHRKIINRERGFWESMPYWVKGVFIGVMLEIVVFILLFITLSVYDISHFSGLGIYFFLVQFIYPYNLLVLSTIIGLFIGYKRRNRK